MNKAIMALLTLIAFMAICGNADAQQEAIDMHLEDTGFVMRAASPQQFERLRALPPLRFVARTVGSRRYYLYADPDLCKCVFLGNETAMQSYRDLVAGTASAPIGGSSGGLPPSSSVTFEEMNPDLNNSITPGDIFDY
jgi:hypothetical protein